MNVQQAADFLSESPQHEISRHKAHIKILEEALTMKRESYKKLEEQNAELLEALEWAVHKAVNSVGCLTNDDICDMKEAIRKVS